MAKKKGEKSDTGSVDKVPGKRKPKATTIYPKYSLVEALRLAESIRDNNAGEPYNRIDLAASIEMSPESSTFRTLITASSRYGLTEGGYQAERIAITDLGKTIVSPMSDEEKSEGLLKALYNVEFYKLFFGRFQNHRLPRKDLLLNTLEREYNIPKTDRDQCYDLLIKNATELALLKDIGGTLYVRFDQPAILAPTSQPESEASQDTQNVPQQNNQHAASVPEVTIVPSAKEDIIAPSGEGSKTHKPRIFISHSKNMKILTQIKSNLEFGGFSYKVAIETETTAIPIPEKIFGMMRECNCAIVNVSADEQEKRPDDSFSVNPNVLVEIGAAFLAYNQRVILLVDRRVALPSNLQGLYRCEYQGDDLDSASVTSRMLKNSRNIPGL